MIELLIPALAQAVAPPATPPADWAPLPELTLRPRGDAGARTAFVSGEVAAGRCTAQPGPDGRISIGAPVAVLIDPQGRVRQITPRAIGCPTVEQYTVGYVSTLVRDLTTAPRPGWYRVTITYQWTR